MDKIRVITTRKRVYISINGVMYCIAVFINLNDMEIFLDALNTYEDSKRALASIIYNKISKNEISAPSLEKILKEPDNSFSEFILTDINSNSALKEYYDNTDVSLPNHQRYALAYRKYWNGFTDRLKSISILPPAIKMALNQTWPITRDINSINRILAPIRNSILIANRMNLERYLQSFSGLQNQVRQMALYSNIGLQGFRNTLYDFIKTLRIPKYTARRISEIENSFTRWGKAGWTIIPTASNALFECFPSNEKDANRQAMKHCTTKDIHELFNLLFTQKVNKSDLSESIYCYEHKRYKACALILAGIIDAKIIRIQPKPKDEKKQRLSGSKAIKALEKRYYRIDNNLLLFRQALYSINIITFLECFFESGHDFRCEPRTINRNYLCHGMNRNPVSKTQCIQLFLALYNLMEFLDLLRNSR